jgi:hypothetical protein
MVNLGACTPIPAYKCFVCASRYKVSRGERNCVDSVQVSGKLLEGGKGDRREEVHTGCYRYIIKQCPQEYLVEDSPDIVETNDKDLSSQSIKESS